MLRVCCASAAILKEKMGKVCTSVSGADKPKKKARGMPLVSLGGFPKERQLIEA